MNRAKVRLARWMQYRLGDDFGGYPAPPGQNAELDFGMPDDDTRPMFVARVENDGFEMWIGYRHKWLFHCMAGDARRLAWWILWRWWVVGTWCGLKRWLFYRALDVVVRSYDDDRRRERDEREYVGRNG